MDVINSGSFAIPAALNSENDVRSMCKTPANSKKLSASSLNSINNSSLRKKFGQLSNNVQCTPIQQQRRKLGNVSNTPLSNSCAKPVAGFSKPSSFSTNKNNNFETTKPPSNCSDLIRKTPTAPTLPIVYEEIENYYPDLDNRSCFDSYATVGVFEIDRKQMLTIPFEDDDEPKVHHIKSNTPCLF